MRLIGPDSGLRPGAMVKCKQAGTARTILFNLSGHGNFDMQAYAEYFAGKLEDRDLDQTALDTAFAELPRLAAA